MQAKATLGLVAEARQRFSAQPVTGGRDGRQAPTQVPLFEVAREVTSGGAGSINGVAGIPAGGRRHPYHSGAGQKPASLVSHQKRFQGPPSLRMPGC
jgi:hypothetical protein